MQSINRGAGSAGCLEPRRWPEPERKNCLIRSTEFFSVFIVVGANRPRARGSATARVAVLRYLKAYVEFSGLFFETRRRARKH